MYDRVICIPACQEYHYLPEALDSLSQLPYRKLVLVSNNCRIDSTEEVKRDNHQLHEWILQFPHRQNGNRYEIQYPNIDILYFDHSHDPWFFTPRQGVGLARKNLATEAIRLIEAGLVQSKWIWCSDADVLFPMNYLEEPSQKNGTVLFGYFHRPAPPELLLYEASLRYYSLGLKKAGYPLAFPTIGSTICIHKDTYLKSHGFSDRQAAEDFYLLNKAAKIHPVHYSKECTITIKGRPSSRVPFGTGQAMQSIKADNCTLNSYAPVIFERLETWVDALYHCSDSELLPRLQHLVPDYPYFKKFQKVLRQKANPRTSIRRRFEFFDPFQVMRFIHHLRDHHHPSIPLQEALQTASFIDSYHSTQSLEDLQQDLYQEEKSILRGQNYHL